MENINVKGKRALIFFIVLIIAVAASSGCGRASLTDSVELLSEEEEVQVEALLGDLREDTSDSVRQELGRLLHDAKSIEREREQKGDYEMSQSEYEIWDSITELLDRETIRQFGEYESWDENGSSTESVDFGKEILKNLKSIVSEQDWKKLNTIRNKYFEAEDNNEDYDLQVEEQIRDIVENYHELDADAVMLNLLDFKDQKTQGIFRITSDLKAVYQNGRENGLNELSEEDQEELSQLWETVTEIMPAKLFSDFKYLKVGGDGPQGTLAYVVPVDEDGVYWCLSVDPQDVADDGLFPYTVVHEISHYVTFNEEQVDYFTDEHIDFPHDRYTDYECVAKEDSYLQGFYDSFWKYIVNDWATHTENPYFYYRHQSEFVTGYASTECAEDLAEVFSAYVLLEQAPTPKIQAKFDYFDSFEELRQLKADILAQINKNDIYVSPEIELTD